MRHYETIFIINPELSDEDTQALIERFQGVLTSGGAEMVKVDPWGRRRMAYNIKRATKGFYVLFEYGSEPAPVAEMERQFKIEEHIMRFLTVKLGDVFDPLSIQQAEESKRAAEESRKAAKPVDDEDDDADQDDDESEED